MSQCAAIEKVLNTAGTTVSTGTASNIGKQASGFVMPNSKGRKTLFPAEVEERLIELILEFQKHHLETTRYVIMHAAARMIADCDKLTQAPFIHRQSGNQGSALCAGRGTWRLCCRLWRLRRGTLHTPLFDPQRPQALPSTDPPRTSPDPPIFFGFFDPFCRLWVAMEGASPVRGQDPPPDPR